MNPQFLQAILGMLQQQQQPRMQGFGGYGQGLPPQLMQMLMQQQQFRHPPMAPIQPGMRTDVSTNPTLAQEPMLSNRPTLAQPDMNTGGIVGQMAAAAGMPSRFGPAPAPGALYGQAAAPISNVGAMSPGNAMVRPRFPVRRMIGGGY